jgi:hypothetical protein
MAPRTGKAVEESHELQRVGDAVHAALAVACRKNGEIENNLDSHPNIEMICEINRVKEKEVRPLYKRGLKAFRTICAELLGEEPKEVGTELASSEEIGGEILLTGTVDLVTQPLGLDWKSGYRIYEPKWQLNGYKRLHCFEYGVIVWLRDDVIDVYRDLLEAPDFDDALMEQLRRIGREEVFGEHCFGCQRQHECETYRWQMRNTTMAMDMVRDGNTELSPQALAHMKPRVALLEQAIEKYKSMLKWAIAAAGPQPVGDGKELAITEKSRTTISPSKGYPIIEKYIGKEKFLSLLDIKKTKLVEAVQETAEKGQKAKKAREFLKDLEAEGAVSKSTFTEMRVRRIVK